MKTKWTARVRRAIPHLLKFIDEDVDHGPFDDQHPMYRRLKAADKAALKDLRKWLEEQAPSTGDDECES